MVFLGVYRGFELLATKTIVKNENNHEFSRFLDSWKNCVCFFVFLVLEWFCNVFWFFLVLPWFRGPDHKIRCRSQEKAMNFQVSQTWLPLVSLRVLIVCHFTLVLQLEMLLALYGPQRKR